eukprot:TRINITY_DN28095_c0_g1_i5.p1 TRINITY_DN28095_c0_g1~~TRINITY_DN28095_c0_g1_i5.p1  ORF type:complete len:174 (+),score=7.28 TRINITY_DN28095_c0_g1_i5:375-896(+)
MLTSNPATVTHTENKNNTMSTNSNTEYRPAYPRQCARVQCVIVWKMITHRIWEMHPVTKVVKNMQLHVLQPNNTIDMFSALITVSGIAPEKPIDTRRRRSQPSVSGPLFATCVGVSRASFRTVSIYDLNVGDVSKVAMTSSTVVMNIKLTPLINMFQQVKGIETNTSMAVTTM